MLRVILAVLLWALSPARAQLPDLYVDESHGDPPFLSQPGWRPLLNGKDLHGWHGVGRETHGWSTTRSVTWRRIFDPKRLTFTPSPGDRMVNGQEGRAAYLETDEAFGDCEVYLEFMLAAGSNSGVFFNGKYEVQLFDSFGFTGTLMPGDNGAIYRLWDGAGGWPPLRNASRPPGAWQSLHVWFRPPRFEGGRKIANARFLRVLLNEMLVHEDVEIAAPTGNHKDRSEAPRGPLMLQGDHGPVAFRSIYLRPLKAP
ncbi:MAG: DUF1080 domain-containing protein [Bryobacterales bacterium]|nr:DUF1080 domain-containing protein [Bryobacterales bacterium]